MPNGLTAKQTDFVRLFTQLGSETYNNAVRSALAAGYSQNTAQLACRDILAKPRVKDAIARAKAEIQARTEVTLEEVTANARWLVENGKQTKDRSAVSQGNKQLGDIIGAYHGKDTQQAMQINISLPDTGHSKPIDSESKDKA